MKNSILKISVICLVFFLGFLGCERKPQQPDGSDDKGGTSSGNVNNNTGGAKESIRVGYINNVVINAHTGVLLEKSNILNLNNLNGQVKGYDSNSDLVSAFNRNSLDVVIIEDFLGINMLAKGSNGLIIGSLGSIGRVMVVVEKDSPILNVDDLKGKQIGVTLNSRNHFHLFNA